MGSHAACGAGKRKLQALVVNSWLLYATSNKPPRSYWLHHKSFERSLFIGPPANNPATQIFFKKEKNKDANADNDDEGTRTWIFNIKNLGKAETSIG